MSDSVRPHKQQPARLRRPWDFPGKSTGVGCHCLLQEDILMRTRDFDATLMCGITDSAQGMGHSRSHRIQKEDPIPKFSHFQTPLNSSCALEPNVPSLWYVTELLNV